RRRRARTPRATILLGPKAERLDARSAQCRPGRGGDRYAHAMDRPTSVVGWQQALAGERYLADRGLATAIHLALALDKPLLLEGEAGVGKTEVAKTLASLLQRRLIRLQCY